MKNNLIISVTALMFVGSVGCTNSRSLPEIVKSGDTVSAPVTAPSAPAPSSSSGDSVTPSDSTPLLPPPSAPAPSTPTPSADPVASGDPSTTPPPLPPPAVGPGASDPVKMSPPSGILMVAPSLLAPKQTLGLTGYHQVEVTGWTGSGGDVHSFNCPANYVVTGFRIGTDSYDVTPDGGLNTGSIESTTLIAGGMRVLCSHIDTVKGVDHTRIEETVFASYFRDPGGTDGSSGLTLESVDIAGKNAANDVAFGCPNDNHVSVGVFGRNGDRLDSFGLSCAYYIHTDKVTAVLDSSYETPTSDDSMYGGAPGVGGTPFEARCDTNETITGVSIASGDQVNGITGLTCAKMEMVDIK